MDDILEHVNGLLESESRLTLPEAGLAWREAMHMESDRREVGSGVLGCIIFHVPLASQSCVCAKHNHAMCFRDMHFAVD